MIELDIEYVKDGDILAKTQEFVNYYGGGSSTVVDLRKGVKLTSKMIEKLISFGIKTIWIEDKNINYSIEQKVLNVSLEDKVKSVDKIKQIFTNMKNKNNFDIKEVEDLTTRLIEKIIDTLNSKEGFNLIPEMMTAIDSHDSYTFEHSVNVMIYAIILATNIDDIIYQFRTSESGMKYLNEGNVYFYIGMNMILHDIGKTLIPLDILNKESKLTEEEMNIMKSHPKKAFELIRKINKINLEKGKKEIPFTYLVASLYHHNTWNGINGYPKIETDKFSGYPIGREIPLIGRICAIADRFDALTTQRPYRQKLHTIEAIQILKSQAGIEIDKELTEKFISLVNPFQIGTTVKLDNGDLGVIIGWDKDKFNPIVKPYIRKVFKNGQYETIKLGHPAKKIFESNYDIILNGKFYKKELYGVL